MTPPVEKPSPGVRHPSRLLSSRRSGGACAELLPLGTPAGRSGLATGAGGGGQAGGSPALLQGRAPPGRPFRGDGMLGWMERVVPQPPGGSPAPAAAAVRPPAAERAGEAGPEPARQPGLPAGAHREAEVGLIFPAPRGCSASRPAGGGRGAPIARCRTFPLTLPSSLLQTAQLPAGSPASPAKAEGANEETSGAGDPVSTTESTARGVLAWLSQGLEKVIPQPAQSPSRALTLQAAAASFEASIDIPDLTEVQSLKAEAEEEEELEVSLVDPDEDEPCDVQSSSDNNPEEMLSSGGRNVFAWLREGFGKMMPQQPESPQRPADGTPEGPAAEQANAKRDRQEMLEGREFPGSPHSSSETKCGSAADGQPGFGISLFPRTLGGDGGRLFERLVQGLEKAMPQPAARPRPDGQESPEAGDRGVGQERSKGA
ncbi:cyclic nucleotide-gated cation channel beta-1-like [Varanus komodoensis]|uniref:cyclic nucleotide-gated cation channel beta-1-like n=1 Tax=Varanus komodoensis TaxID=61221 RepID=UPI001CF7AC2B|nr:cyclic nucleotide-gated cation channel beta-1-like [Varanus komodoensis]